MKPMIPHAFTLCLALSALLLAQSPLHASEMDDKIVSAAQNS
jgi:hypothetical protein